jgi:hypothetical protein
VESWYTATIEKSKATDRARARRPLMKGVLLTKNAFSMSEGFNKEILQQKPIKTFHGTVKERESE